MKRDMDLIHSVLLTLEQTKTNVAPDLAYFVERLGKEKPDEFRYLLWHQILLCEDAGFLTISRSRGGSPASINRLTWAGHEKLDELKALHETSGSFQFETISSGSDHE